MRRFTISILAALLGFALCAPASGASLVSPTDLGQEVGPDALRVTRTATPSGALSTNGATDVQNLTTLAYFSTIQAAIDDAGTLAGHVLEVQAASHAEGICVVSKAVTIRGRVGGAIITSTTDTQGPNTGNAQAWFLVTVAGVRFEDLTLDGTNNLIRMAIRFNEAGAVARCTIQHIKRPPAEHYGIGIVITKNVTVTDCAFSDIGRVGVFLYATGVTAGVVSGCTYTGKGAGADWLDYGLELGGGAVATLTNNTVSACTGTVTSLDPPYVTWGSAGVLITYGSIGTLTGNVVTGSSVGVAVGYNTVDLATAVAHSNDLSGNIDYALTNKSNTITLDASANWWGTNTPAGVLGETSVTVDCTPWFHNAGDVNLAPGFQGDYSILDVDDDSPQTPGVGRIQEGVNLVSGSTVNVAAGNYLESNILLDRSLTVQGVGAFRDDVVVAPAAEDGNVDTAFGTNPQNGFVIKAHGVTIRNLTINGRGNPALTPNKNNFRAGIVSLDASQAGGGAWNDLHVDDVFVKHAYRRGISVFPTTVSGTVIENSRVDSTAFNYGMYLAGQSQAIDNTVRHCFQGIVQALDATTPAGLIKATGNTLTGIGNFPGCWGDQGAGVYSGQPRAIQFNNSNSAGRTVEIRDNIIDDSGSAGLGGAVGIYTRLANSASIVDNNTITMTSGTSWAVDGGSQSVGMLLGWSYANGFAATNNRVSSSGFGMGVMVFGSGTLAQPMVLEGNTLTGVGSTRTTQGDGTGIYIANQYLFATDKNESYVVIRNGNAISGFVRGIDVEKVITSTQPLTVTVNGNSIAGNGTGLDASTLTTAIDASCNWWGDALGPNVPPANPSPGDGIVGLASYAPWWSTVSGPCDSYGPNHVAPVAPATCVTPAYACVQVPVNFNRTDPTPVRGYSVTLTLSSNLALCGAGIVEGGYLSGAGSTNFGPVLALGGGVYTVDCAILGPTAGATGTGTLFTLNLAGAVTGTGTVTVNSVTVRDVDNAPVAAIPGPPATITIDNTAPGAVTLAAVQRKSGNDGDGTTKIDLTWSGTVTPGDSVLIYRAGWGNYPEYDDVGGGVPASPTYPPGAPWALAGAVVGASVYADEPAARDFWYYVAFVKDPCGNVGPISNQTGGTLNYHLGDVHDGSPVVDCVGDNVVGIADISFLGAHYGAAVLPGFNCLDVGPTTNYSVNARPTTDNKVNFEDLMMFAINHGVVSAPQNALQPVAGAASDELWLEGPAKVVAGTTFTVSLRLKGAGDLQGLSAQLGWDGAVAEPVSVEAGGLATAQNAVVLSGGAGSVDAALLGANRGFTGEGVLATVTFRALASGAPAVKLAKLDARDLGNQPVALAGVKTPVLTATAFAPAMPNPFSRTTTLSYALAKGGAVELAVYGVDGRKVAVLASGVQEAGSYRLTWDGAGVRPGMYYARLTTPEGRFTRTLVLTR